MLPTVHAHKLVFTIIAKSLGKDVEVRLQVHGDGWTVHTGRTTDTAGYWGRGFLAAGCDQAVLASDLIEQVSEQLAIA